MAERTARAALFGALALVVILCWAYTVAMPDMDRVMAEVQAMAAGEWQPWTGAGAVFTFLMWAAMMIAMMLPTALPMLVVFDRIAATQGRGAAGLAAFVAGYALLWLGFSLAATVLEALLHRIALLDLGMRSASPVLSGLLLIGAGAYQLSPLKQACLARCRSPLAFILAEWRSGTAGALIMGLRHGLVCLGCCWLLMALLFVGGVMNLLWIAVLTITVLVEKLAPSARVASVLGVGLIGWGVVLLAARAWSLS